MEINTLGQQLLFNTVPIETFDRSNNPIGTGTSFIISHKFDSGYEDIFLITNKHVIADAWSGYIYFTHIKDNKPDIGNPFFIKLDPMFEQMWHPHPEPDIDIAILELKWQFELIQKGCSTPFYKSISTDLIPSTEDISILDVLEPVVFVGYPNGIFDHKNYTPILRRGALATPYQLNYDNRPVFLIDASVFPGSSGSPVFLYKTGNSNYSDNLKLLGIISEVFIRQDIGIIGRVPTLTKMESYVTLKEMIDLGVVIKSETIIETLNDFWKMNGSSIEEMERKKYKL